MREWPPGYGGVERVAHELAEAWQSMGYPGMTLSLLGPDPLDQSDPLPVNYCRRRLPSLAIGQLLIPLPTRSLLQVVLGKEPLHIHLPCPSLLAISIFARLLRPRRQIRLHWHAFLESDSGGFGLLLAIYQWLALRWAAVGVQQVVTTSPVLAKTLAEEGVPRDRIILLPCCLPASIESRADRLWEVRRAQLEQVRPSGARLICIGRLDSYKRVDWLIQSFSVSGASRLDIVGEGPRRRFFERLASQSPKADSIIFHGRLSESAKQDLLASSDLLILPADRSNEAFGIVQLEAMVCGVPALALDQPRSGMAWVGGMEERQSMHLGSSSVISATSNLSDRLRFLIKNFIESPDELSQEALLARRRYESMFARSVWLRRLHAIGL